MLQEHLSQELLMSDESASWSSRTSAVAPCGTGHWRAGQLRAGHQESGNQVGGPVKIPCRTGSNLTNWCWKVLLQNTFRHQSTVSQPDRGSAARHASFTAMTWTSLVRRSALRAIPAHRPRGRLRCDCGRSPWRSRRRGSCGRCPRRGRGARRSRPRWQSIRPTASTSRSRGVSGEVPCASVAAARAGSTTRSPDATRRIASASWSTGVSFTTKPTAPDSIARRR